jgi:hypothetical protein
MALPHCARAVGLRETEREARALLASARARAEGVPLLEPEWKESSLLDIFDLGGVQDAEAGRVLETLAK